MTHLEDTVRYVWNKRNENAVSISNNVLKLILPILIQTASKTSKYVVLKIHCTSKIFAKKSLLISDYQKKKKKNLPSYGHKLREFIQNN